MAEKLLEKEILFQNDLEELIGKRPFENNIETDIEVDGKDIKENDTDQPSWYARSIKLYVNGSLFKETTWAEGDGGSATASTYYRITGLAAGSSPVIRTESYGWNGQLIRTFTWTNSVIGITLGNDAIGYWQRMSNPPANELSLIHI